MDSLAAITRLATACGAGANPVVEAATFRHAPSRMKEDAADVVTAVHVADMVTHRDQSSAWSLPPAEYDHQHLQAMGWPHECRGT